MGLPEIIISFQRKADTAIRSGSRGMVAVVLDDTTKNQMLTPYRRWRDVVQEDWTKESLKALELVFKGSPQRVVAVRLLKDEETPDLAGTLKEILPLNIDYLAYPAYTAGDKEALQAYLEAVRRQGKKAKAVLPDCAADDPHVVNFATTGVTALWENQDEVQTYTGAEYCCRVAGILAGLPLDRSCTYYELPEVVDAKLPADAGAEVDAGKLVVVFDGEKYKLGRGVTSLTSITEERPEDLKKIKIVEGMDVIIHDIYTTFEDEYVGKVVNSYDNKQMFVGAVNDYLKKMEGSVLDETGDNFVEVDLEANREYLKRQGIDTEEMTDTQIREANTGSYLFLTGACRVLDAMEDLTLKMNM